MADFSTISQLIAEIQQQLEQLAADVEEIRRGDAGASTPAGPYDLTKVIPPTVTDEPDSIIGGLATRDFPDCCSVGNDDQFYCTGTLIAPNVVVTAGHCTGATRVFLKGYNINQPETGEIIRVKKENGEYLRYVHETADLMVLVLEHDSIVTPRHVAQGLEVRDVENCTLVGFGTINFSGTQGYGVKRVVTVPITSLGCNSAEEANDYGCEQGSEIVAGHRGLDRDSCKGDSGGPLYILSSFGEYYLLGATSRGASSPDGPTRVCGDGGIYVRVDVYLDWIREKTGVSIEGARI